ncbi:MAG: WD40 repeat domain-containing protein [Chloroflexota bacterium]|nr:WD40 repeat domain-containing protein [Chloroflexota bacterium]
MRLRLVILAVLILTVLAVASVQADDIPANCETGSSPNIFARYEAHNSRLMLVDWNTGADVLLLASDLPETRILGWSLDCRYLATAVGTLESMDTVVWDVTQVTRVGAVPDAHMQPHHITWGPHNFLIVETRSGAVLWNVPANTQVILTTAFNTFTARNFSRLRWDADNRQVIGDLATGGREVYSLDTGSQVEVAADSAVVYPRGSQSELTLAGNRYLCNSDSNRGAIRASDPSLPIQPSYNSNDHTVTIVLPHQYTGVPHDQVLAVLETNLAAPWVEFRGFTTNCRYLIAAVGRAGEDASDTVVWDIIEARRVGVVLDARQIRHPLHIGADALLITTRDGGYLWYLPTNTLTLLNPVVETSLDGQPGIFSFGAVAWDNINGQVLTTLVGQPGAIQVFDVANGQGVGSYGLIDAQVSYMRLSPQATTVLAYNDNLRSVEVIHRASGIRLTASSRLSVVSFSPDERYAATSGRDEYFIWDLQALNADGSPTFIYPRQDRVMQFFVDSTTIRLSDGSLLNVLTGETTVMMPSSDGGASAPAVSGQSGMGTTNYWWSSNADTALCINSGFAYEPSRGELTITRSDGSMEIINTSYPYLSPACTYISAFVASASSTTYDASGLEGSYDARLNGMLTFWRVATTEPIAEIPVFGRGRGGGLINWSPDSSRAFVGTTAGNFLLNTSSGQWVMLSSDLGSNGQYNEWLIRDWSYHIYWDFTRGQVYIPTQRGVAAFDIETGVMRYFLQGASYFSISADGRYLFAGGVTIWDLDRAEIVARLITPYPTLDYLGSHIAISPDERYLVMGYNVIRVWDLASLPAAIEDRVPVTFNGPAARVRSLRFVDNVTIEVVTAVDTTYWNVETGEQVTG